MQALINAATTPGTAASVVNTNCATETTLQKVEQKALIKLTNAAVHLAFKEPSIFNLVCVS